MLGEKIRPKADREKLVVVLPPGPSTAIPISALSLTISSLHTKFLRDARVVFLDCHRRTKDLVTSQPYIFLHG
jgi:hypothetical protein